MNDTEMAQLKAAVERAHRCPATYRASERVREQNQQFEVALFDILGIPAPSCVTPGLLTGGSPNQRKAFTVLREGPIHTSVDAVRFALEDTTF